MTPQELIARYGSAEGDPTTPRTMTLKEAIAHVTDRCYDRAQQLDWPDFDPLAAVVILQELQKHIKKTLCRVCAERPVTRYAYWSDREWYICDASECRAYVIHQRDTDGASKRMTMYIDGQGVDETIPYISGDQDGVGD
jgi:hypothetical protein